MCLFSFHCMQMRGEASRGGNECLLSGGPRSRAARRNLARPALAWSCTAGPYLPTFLHAVSGAEEAASQCEGIPRRGGAEKGPHSKAGMTNR